MTNELNSKKSEILNLFKKDSANQQVELFIEAPDIYLAATIMIQSNFSEGKGDLTRIIKTIIANPTSCPSLIEKLKILKSGKFKGHNLFADKFKEYPKTIKIGKHYQFILWFNLVRKREILTNEEFIELIPESKERALFWY